MTMWHMLSSWQLRWLWNWFTGSPAFPHPIPVWAVDPLDAAGVIHKAVLGPLANDWIRVGDDGNVDIMKMRGLGQFRWILDEAAAFVRGWEVVAQPNL